MKVQVAKWGNSTAVRLPKAVVQELGLAQGMMLNVTIDDGAVKLEPAPDIRKPEPITLEWIVAEMRRLGPENEPETEEWGPDVGSEIIHDG